MMKIQVREPQTGAGQTVGLTWKGLLRFGGIGLAVLLAAAAAGLRDLEAAAMTIGAVAALGLLGCRRGLLGMIGLGLLSANAALWMTPSALSNITHSEGFWESALPSALTVVSFTTVIAAVAALTGVHSHTHGSRGARALAVATVVVLVAVLTVSAVGSGEATQLEPGDIRLVTEQVKFSSTVLEAGDGRVGVYVANRDLFWHTFTVKALHVNLNVPVGSERRIEFDAAPGSYDFTCKIPGHVQAGMKGTLTVR